MNKVFIKDFLSFYECGGVVCSSSTGMVLWGSSLPCIDVVCICWLVAM
jgi:hypothetical protein